MSVAEMLPAVSSLPRAEKIQLLQFIAGELAREEACAPSASECLFVPPAADQCPYTPAELARMFQESGGAPLSEVWLFGNSMVQV